MKQLTLEKGKQTTQWLLWGWIYGGSDPSDV